MVTRRSVTIDDINERGIMGVRGAFMQAGRDLDYTKALNILLYLGIRRIEQGALDPGQLQSIRKFIDDNGLSEQEIRRIVDEMRVVAK